MIAFESLTVFDFEVLKVVSARQPIKIGDLIAALPGQKAVLFRVELLAGITDTPDVRRLPNRPEDILPVSKTNYLHYRDNIVRLTPLGAKSLEDYQAYKERRKIDSRGELFRLTVAALSGSILGALLNTLLSCFLCGG